MAALAAWAAPVEGMAPPGWSLNPSAWSHRRPLAILAAVGLLIATYLALYQYRVFDTVWEPFFGQGSAVVLNSGISQMLPVSDATLGALAYAADLVFLLIGNERRWQRAPWIVILLGANVVMMAVVSVVLMILQPVAFGAWCTLCLCSAAISLTVVGPGLYECLAGLQVMRRAQLRGDSLWQAFLHGEEGETGRPLRA